MGEPRVIGCSKCHRKATLGVEVIYERMAQRRWFVIETTWDEHYSDSYALVCGGNDQKLFHQLDSGVMKEIDSCLGAEMKLHSSQLPHGYGDKWGMATSETTCHLFLPELFDDRILALLDKVPFKGMAL